MKKFSKQESIELLVAQILAAEDEEAEIKQAIDSFLMKLYKHYKLDRVENVKKGSWKVPIREAKKALIAQDLGGVIEYFHSNWALIEKVKEEEIVSNTVALDQEEEKQDRTTDDKPVKEVERTEEAIASNTVDRTTDDKSVAELVAPEQKKAEYSLLKELSTEELELVVKAIEFTGTGEIEFIKRATVNYAKNYLPHMSWDLATIETEKLVGSRIKGSGEELTKRGIDAIIEYNNSQPEKANRYRITVNLVKQLTGVRHETISKILNEYHDLIETHHQHKVSHERSWNRGKLDICKSIPGFKAPNVETFQPAAVVLNQQRVEPSESSSTHLERPSAVEEAE